MLVRNVQLSSDYVRTDETFVTRSLTHEHDYWENVWLCLFSLGFCRQINGNNIEINKHERRLD